MIRNSLNELHMGLTGGFSRIDIVISTLNGE